MYDLVSLVQEVTKDLCKIFFENFQVTVFQVFKIDSGRKKIHSRGHFESIETISRRLIDAIQRDFS